MPVITPLQAESDAILMAVKLILAVVCGPHAASRAAAWVLVVLLLALFPPYLQFNFCD